MEEPTVLGRKVAANGSDRKVPRENTAPRNIFLRIWKKFGESTSLHGLGRAINSRNIYLKLMWGVLVIAGFCAAGRNVYETISTYLTYPVTTVVSVESHQNMEFPAVTICNVNPVKLSAIAPRWRGELVKEAERGAGIVDQSWYLNPHNTNVILEGAKNDMFYEMSDMLVNCDFNWDACQADEFKTMHNFLYGRCFTYNAYLDRLPVKNDRPGNRNGLILELDIQEDNYLPLISTVGVKVVVHPRDQIPFPEDAGIMAGPGRVTSIGIRKATVTRQPHPWGSCIHSEDVSNSSSLNMFGDSTVYTTTVCEKTCYQRSMIETCKCCDKKYPCNETVLREITGLNGPIDTICDEEDRDKLRCVSRVREDHAAGMLSCMDKCSPSCKENTYRTHYSTGFWPAEKFQRIVIDKAKETVMHKRKDSNPYPAEITSDFVSKNFLRLEVYFENFVEELILTNRAYDWNKLLSDIGGQMGLWLGLSIMTAVEILEFLHDITGLALRRILNFRNLGTKQGSTMARQDVFSLDKK